MAMLNHNTVYLGTELKLNIHIEPIDGLSMKMYDFEVEVYCNPKKIATASKKGDALTNLVSRDDDDNNYIALIDTNIIGVGKMMCKVTAYIKDNDFADNLRTEVVVMDTGITIVK
jgi:hypothetical protein